MKSNKSKYIYCLIFILFNYYNSNFIINYFDKLKTNIINNRLNNIVIRKNNIFDSDNQNYNFINCIVKILDNNNIHYDNWIINYDTFYDYNFYNANIDNFLNTYPNYQNISHSMLCIPYVNFDKSICEKCIKFFRGGLFKTGYFYEVNSENDNIDVNKQISINECLQINNDLTDIRDILNDITDLDILGTKQSMNTFCLLTE